MSAQMRPVSPERRASNPLTPYAIAFGSWWALAMFATSVRVAIRPWRYVLELFWWQALLLERLIGLHSALVTRAVWLLAYVAIGLVCGWILERKRAPSDPHVWRRAWIAAGASQMCLLLLAMATSAE
jgi:hypothetical protein